jgi:hypothetical protein
VRKSKSTFSWEKTVKQNAKPGNGELRALASDFRFDFCILTFSALFFLAFSAKCKLLVAAMAAPGSLARPIGFLPSLRVLYGHAWGIFPAVECRARRNLKWNGPRVRHRSRQEILQRAI